MLVILIAILWSYFFFLLILILGWSKAMRGRVRNESAVKITVVVAMRNEAENVHALLENLTQQRYRDYEIILVDDHSEDATYKKIEEFQAVNPEVSPRIILFKNQGTGKKAAITTGVISASGEIIVTTDADCRFNPEWLRIISGYYSDKNTMMTIGAVRLQQDGTLFTDLQAIEFSSLIGSAAATLSLGFPMMCNGANLSYRKSVFGEVGGYQDNLHIPSGDDEFLMRKVAEHYPDGIRFLRQPSTVVTTKASSSVSDFLQQRLRWAGKWRHNSSPSTKVTALFIIFVHISLIASFCLLLSPYVSFIVILLAFRCLLEGIFLFRVCMFLNIRWSWLSFVLLQFIYPFYVIITGVMSNFMSYSWKERRTGQSVS